ncbi:LADA_0C03554g1_1 [Lachancea dasiensis]|uniref:LADA_0C03554g1_1 n=1 Tax=Lachancea dasiensis TaxID=1072105 RepID=A0A1G4IYZ8_9SACH|nr:LADA_0C03554g1_1 [Lachancea dasiensis]
MELPGDPWGSNESSNRPALSGSHFKALKIQETLINLNNTGEAWERLALLIGEDNPNTALFEDILRQTNDLNDKTTTGVTLLIYCIVFDHPDLIEILHGSGQLDPNAPDSLFSNSPLTWCFDLGRQQCLVELLNFADELDFDYKNPGGSRALDTLVPDSEMYEFAKDHGLFRLANASRKDFDSRDQDLYKGPSTVFGGTDVDHTLEQINLQTAGLTFNDENGTFDTETKTPDHEFAGQSHRGSELCQFDFQHILPEQFIEFADYDIPRLLDLVLSLPSKRPHKTCIPAAVIFQCLRHADCNKHSASLVESMAHLALTKVLTSVASSSGGVLNGSNGDIVLQSYWLSALNFLFYYLYRQEGFFKRYPSVLQELINGMRSLVIELNSSIFSRIEPLIDSTILEHTTIAEVKETLYKKDWNLFKKRKHHLRRSDARDSYDQIMRMLYPPDLDEQMKPSPLKVVQIFGALSYVLDLHQVHPLIAQQCLSLALKWFSVELFKKIMENKKKSLSRAHAIQIRLNLSVIQDWIKNHNFKASFPIMMDEFMWQRFPYTLILDLGDIDKSQRPVELRNVSLYRPIKDNNTEDPFNSAFYYQSFYQISKIHMEPCMQLLQWLQVATSLQDEESLQSTLSILNKLTPKQLHKSMRKYRYELEEHQLDSSLRKKLSLMSKETDEADSKTFEKPLYPLVLPTITELTEMYTQREDSDEFLPLIPLDIHDEVDEIHEQNTIQRAMEQKLVNASERKEEELEVESTSLPFENENGDELFKEIHAPSSAAQRPLWAINNDIEENPW